jgi:hypothetical protein
LEEINVKFGDTVEVELKDAALYNESDSEQQNPQGKEPHA